MDGLKEDEIEVSETDDGYLQDDEQEHELEEEEEEEDIPDLVEPESVPKPEDILRLSNLIVASMNYDESSMNIRDAKYETTCDALLYKRRHQMYFIKIEEPRKDKKSLLRSLLKVAIDFETLVTLAFMALIMSCPFSFVSAFIFLLVFYYLAEAYGFNHQAINTSK